MKKLFTLLLACASFTAHTQSGYPYPWNPDADLDGWISTSDLLELLAVFGGEFSPDEWETDSLSAAVVLDGNHGYFNCQSLCNSLEGRWRMADLAAFGRHFDLVSNYQTNFWVNSNELLNSTVSEGSAMYIDGGSGNIYNENPVNLSQAKRCLCYIQASPLLDSQSIEPSSEIIESLETIEAMVDSIASLNLDSLDSVIGGIQDEVAGLQNNSNNQFDVECTEMGYSAICGAVGLEPQVTLAPQFDGYKYSLNPSTNPGDDFLFSAPHWRKFEIHGLPVGYNDDVYLRFEYYTSSSFEYFFREEVIGIPPVIDESGRYFIYFFHGGYSGYSAECVWDGVQLEVPVANAFNLGSYNQYRPFEFGYVGSNGLQFTGVVVDFY